MLSSTRRRHVVHALLDSGGPMSVGDLSLQLAMWENDLDDERDVAPKQRKRVYTALRQTHLTKLDEVGVVVYDPNRGTVEPTSRMESLRPYLREPIRRPWPYYYAVVAVAGLLLTGGVALGVLPEVVTGTLVAGVVSVALCAVAIAHQFTVRTARRDRLAVRADTGTPRVNGDSDSSDEG